jgi:hypothetical protein
MPGGDADVIRSNVDHSVGVWRGYRYALAREDLQFCDEPAEDVQHDADVAACPSPPHRSTPP